LKKLLERINPSSFFLSLINKNLSAAALTATPSKSSSQTGDSYYKEIRSNKSGGKS